MKNINYLRSQIKQISSLIEIYLKKNLSVSEIKDYVITIFNETDTLLEYLWDTPKEELNRLEDDLNLLQYYVDANINSYIKEMPIRHLDGYMKKISDCLNKIYSILNESNLNDSKYMQDKSPKCFNMIWDTQFERIFNCIENPNNEKLGFSLQCYCGAVIFANLLHEKGKDIKFQLLQGKIEDCVSHARVVCDGKVYETNASPLYNKVLKEYKISKKEDLKNKLIKIFKELEQEKHRG